MPDGAFTFTKLIVGDLERTSAFYRDVCGLAEGRRIDATVDGRAITEIILAGEPPGPATLILFAFHDTPAPAAGETILGFYTSDIEAFLERVRRAGGTITQETQSLPDLGLKFAFAKDVEGHLIEALEQL